MCTADGTVFDLANILPWIKKRGTHPVTGQPLTSSSDLIKLTFRRNEEGEHVDPVTLKAFTDSTRVVALRTSGNVFAWDTVDRLNVRPKMWRDLVSDEEFKRTDIIVLQDPQNSGVRDSVSLGSLQDGQKKSVTESEKGSEDVKPDRLLRAKREGMASDANARANAPAKRTLTPNATKVGISIQPSTNKARPYNAAQHTTGQAAASFTSTGVTPHTSSTLATLTDEEYLLKPKRVKHKGYVRLDTSHGPLTIELLPEFAPKAVWNFIALAKRGYYDGVPFHRNIRNFMIQGGDPTGTGKGGESCWGKGKTFGDEFEGPARHDRRGVVSMANKGKNSNSSQFFVTYRPAAHLDRKHTVFGRVVEEGESMETLKRLEAVEVTEAEKRPRERCEMREVSVLVDPFDEWRRERAEKEDRAERQEEVRRAGGTEDDRVTWTGKRIRGDGSVEEGGEAGEIGKYMKEAGVRQGAEEDEIVEEYEDIPFEPVRKKAKAGGGFGNFDGW